jgi:DNA-directed RNA polymerase subunit RPC12/RpoP
MPRPPFPKTLSEFQSKFATEEACQQYFAACRWQDGFVCPRCGSRRACELVKLRGWQLPGLMLLPALCSSAVDALRGRARSARALAHL